MIRGYARVSTQEQNLESQVFALARAGCPRDQIYTDTIGGTVMDKPGLARALMALERGDTLMVWRLDRIGRKLRDLVDIIDDLKRDDIRLVSLTETIDTNTPAGLLAVQMFAAFAEYEREQQNERINAGMAAARARGQRLGRPRGLSPVQVESLHALARAGTSDRDLSKIFKISERTVRDAKAGYGAYAVAPGPPAPAPGLKRGTHCA